MSAGDQLQPLLKASKLNRIEAADLLDDLLVALHDEYDRQAVMIDSAKLKVGGFLERLKAVLPSSTPTETK